MRTTRVIVSAVRTVALEESVIDDAPLPGHLLIRSEASVISAGTELANYTGADAQVFTAGNWNSFPWLAGYGNVGTVIAAGAGAERFRPGQRVFTHGPHASTFQYNAERLVVPVPDGIEPWQAAASRMAGVALTGPMVADLGCHEWVAVLGLGMVGNLAAQQSRLLGARVIGVDPSPARRAVAERCGIPATIAGGDGLERDLRRLCGGQAPAVVIDATGRSDACLAAVRAAAPFGQVVILGTPRQPSPGDLTAVFGAIHGKWLTVRGALEWNLPTWPVHGLRDSLLGKQERIFSWLARGELRLAELISHRLPPHRIRDAYEGLLADPESWTGVVIDWQSA